MLVRVFHRAGGVRVSDANATQQGLQVKTREGLRYLGGKWILAVLVIVVAAPFVVPECVKQAVVMRLPNIGAEWRARKRRTGREARRQCRLCLRGRRGWLVRRLGRWNCIRRSDSGRIRLACAQDHDRGQCYHSRPSHLNKYGFHQ